MKKINKYLFALHVQAWQTGKKIILVLILITILIPAFVSADTDTAKLENPLKADSIEKLVARIVTDFVVPVGGVVVVFFIIYAGFLFIKAQGNPTKIEEARRVLTYVIIGSAVLLGASVLATIVENTVKSLGP